MPPQEGDLLLQEHRAAAHGAAAEAAEGRAAACGKGGTDAGRADARPNAKGGTHMDVRYTLVTPSCRS